jgi:hypothetical protein
VAGFFMRGRMAGMPRVPILPPHIANRHDANNHRIRSCHSTEPIRSCAHAFDT